MDDKELALARAAKAGDVEARNKIVMSMLPFLWKLARRFASSFHPQEDLVHHAVIRILTMFHNYDPGMAIRPITYFGKAAFREMKQVGDRGLIHIGANSTFKRPEHLKDKASKARSVQGIDNLVRCRREPCRFDDNNLADTEERKRVVGMLRNLPARTSFMIRMKMAGHTLDGIAKRTGVTKEAVRQNLKKGFAELRQMMEPANG